jgi:hypothetical protein
MRTPSEYRHQQRSVVYIALLLFNLMLVLLQLWLFVGALENVIAGRPTMVIWAAVVSIACLAVNVWMFVGVARVEHEG